MQAHDHTSVIVDSPLIARRAMAVDDAEWFPGGSQYACIVGWINIMALL